MATDNKSKQKTGNKTKNNNKNKQRYRPNNKAVKKGAYPLRPGVQGFYITCDGGRERQASQEAVNVIDSFYEELVQGTNSKLGQEDLSEKPVNKKTVFKYSDSSSSDDDDNEDGNNGNDEDQTKEETSKIEQHQEKIDDDIDSLKTGKSGPENKENISNDEQIQGNTENKEELETTHELKDIEVGEPPAKKQCVEREAPEAGNIAFGKTEEKSIDKLIEAELAELGDKSKRRFSYLDSGCNGVVFVHMSKKDGDPNPKEIVQHMMSSLALTKKHVSRFILRVLPVEVTCYASEEEIGKAIQPLITKYLPAESDTPKKFAVLYEARANTGINKMKIIDTVAKSVPSPHKVDLSNPEINIVVQIVKSCPNKIEDKWTICCSKLLPCMESGERPDHIEFPYAILSCMSVRDRFNGPHYLHHAQTKSDTNIGMEGVQYVRRPLPFWAFFYFLKEFESSVRQFRK